MKRSFWLLAGLTSGSLLADPVNTAGVPRDIRNDPPHTYVGAAPAAGTEQFVYGEQKAVAGRPVLVAPEQASSLIERFKAAYPKMGSPRFVIFVNRDLVDEQSGLKLAGRTERSQVNSTEVKSEFKADTNAPQHAAAAAIPSASNVTIVGDVSGKNHRPPGAENVTTRTEKAAHENSYKLNEKAAPTLADKQTVRDVERLFGRPLRMAGANLADQKIATQVLPEKTLKDLSGSSDTARREREALKQAADVAIEVLISSRNVTVPELSGDNTYTLPDIQATAVRLSDACLLGQATSTDIIGKGGYAGSVARNFDVREITEATALALMEDMLLNAPQ